MSLALHWTRGRVLYETPAHLRLLDRQIIELHLYATGIDVARASLLEEARALSTSLDWRAGLALLGLTQSDVRSLRLAVLGLEVGPHREVRRALRGWPFPNPFSRVWELQQMRAMYQAAEDVLEDALCDLAVELAPEYGWSSVSQVTRYNNSTKQLQARVEHQRAKRGEHGDPRRVPAQTYPDL